MASNRSYAHTKIIVQEIIKKKKKKKIANNLTIVHYHVQYSTPSFCGIHDEIVELKFTHLCLKGK